MTISAGVWIVFTDLDGTLLDHKTYQWRVALAALDVLSRTRVPLVLVSSKTRAEVLPILRSLKRREPFVVENGGAIYLPRGYFPFRIPGDSPAGRGWYRIVLGVRCARLLRALAAAARQSGTRVRSLDKMSARQVADHTGLTLTAARRAQQREFSEPFEVLDSNKMAESRLEREIVREGFHMTRGGRFFHILGGNDKGLAVKKLIAFYRRASKGRVLSIGLGDSPNDISLLRAVDIPILVARPGGRYDTEVLHSVPGALRAGGTGPAGWNRALLRLMPE